MTQEDETPTIRTIGEIEKLAGVTDRYAFWVRLSELPTDQIIPAGVAALRRIIQENRGKIDLEKKDSPE
jgi:hypothetical protein